MLLPFSLDTYDQRYQRVLERMKQRDLDVLLVNLPDNLSYLCGHESIGYYWYQALIIAPGLEHPVLITRISEKASVDETSILRGTIYYRMHFDDPIQMLVEFLTKHGLAAKRVGIEMQAFNIRPAHWDRIKEVLPNALFHDASNIVLEERLVKSPEEVSFQRNAARIADHAMQAAYGALRPGVTEIEIAGVISKAMADVGGEYPAFPVMVASGPRTTMIHGLPGHRPLVAGDLVTMEFAGVYHRYHAVLMRTAIIGRPPRRLGDVADCVKEATEAAIASAAAGQLTRVPKHVADEKLNRLDLARRRVHRVGYSIGLGFPPAWVEAMALEDSDPYTLCESMSFTIEPNLSLPDEGFGYKMGSTILCTAGGGESLSGLDHDLVVID